MKNKEIATFRKSYKDYDRQCYFQGLKLAVHFDEKEDVKKWGAKWNADGGFWWMPVDRLTVDVHAGIGTVRDWLNDNKMIMGQYGKFNETEHSLNLFSTEGSTSGNWTDYRMSKSNHDPKFKVQFFYDQDVAKFSTDGVSELLSEYLTIEDGRKRWNALIEEGYERIEI